MSGWSGELLLGLVVLLGATVQWLAGLGFALVAAPVLVLLLGPNSGVTLANFAALAISAVGLAGSWRQVRPGAMLPLMAASVCAVPAGARVAATVPTPELLVGIGVLVTAAALTTGPSRLGIGDRGAGRWGGGRPAADHPGAGAAGPDGGAGAGPRRRSEHPRQGGFRTLRLPAGDAL
ncbi:sulfite exporter TauE/SafE family protein [Kitasatospora aureofaciens]|uniref:sulfite exporter TauE/SafE family protein n=1 Tax=Kitasatospora aureofaciens TaxID=1894 RepID=UPI0036F496F7